MNKQQQNHRLNFTAHIFALETAVILMLEINHG